VTSPAFDRPPLGTIISAFTSCGPREHILAGGFLIATSVPGEQAHLSMVQSAPVLFGTLEGWYVQAIATASIESVVNLVDTILCTPAH